MPLVLRRQHIREHTVAVLQAAQTAAGDRVYPSPVLPWRRERPLPAIGVYTKDERGVAPDGRGHSGPFQLRQSLELVIEALVELPTEAELTQDERLRLDTQAPLDALCAQISVALLSNPDWYAPIGEWPPPLFDGLPARATRVEFGRVENTDRRTAAATITHTVTYGCVAEPNIKDDFLVAFFDVDVIDPAADPNIKYPGPDGRIEVTFTAPGPRDPPLWPVDVTELEGDRHAS
jgi:hypothetical protein